VYGVVHGIGWARRRQGLSVPALTPQTDLAILNWRREKSVFLGTNQPEEDASWIFQLRMAELERAKAGRTSEPRPWNRLGARLFDYAIWGLVLALLSSELAGIDAIPERLAYWISHPLVAPVLITTTWVPIEALLIASLATTPGKWLFGCYIQFSISDAYAERSTRAQLERGIRRAFRVWWQGVGCGIPVLAPIMIAIAYERVMQNQETDWDFAQDCLVTTPRPALNAVTGVAGLAAMLWLYGVAWHRPLADTVMMARTAIVQSIPSPRSLLPQGIDGNAVPGIVGGITRPSSSSSASSVTAPTALPGGAADAPVDAEVATLFAERKARIAARRPRRGAARRNFGGGRAVRPGPIWSSRMPTRGAVSATPSRRRATTRTRSTRIARRSSSMRRSHARCRIERSQKGIVADSQPLPQ
jgi:hypothetical protein